MFYGYNAFLEFQHVSSGRLDCFIDLGAYKVCDATQRLSIFTSLVLLMTQALISRTLAPGISNFVNASVKRLLPPARPSSRMTVVCDFLASRATGVVRGLKP
jgi:hypothetical protein